MLRHKAKINGDEQAPRKTYEVIGSSVESFSLEEVNRVRFVKIVTEDIQNICVSAEFVADPKTGAVIGQAQKLQSGQKS